MSPAYFCHVSFMKISIYHVYWNLLYSLIILKVIFLKSNPFRFKETNNNGAIGKGMQPGTVLWEMLIEATFRQTNFWFISFSFLWHKILVLIFNMFIYVKVVHSKFVEMREDASDLYRSASKSNWYFIPTTRRKFLPINQTVYMHTGVNINTFAINKINFELQKCTVVLFQSCKC